MIKRYSNPEAERIWSDRYKYQLWLKVEKLALEGMVEANLAPAEALDVVNKITEIDPKQVLEAEEKSKHDVIAFLTVLNRLAGPMCRYVHRGMTSSDLLDTAFAVQLKEAGELILDRLNSFSTALREKALEYKDCVCIGRTHGVHAEPTTLGLKFLGFWKESRRNYKRLRTALQRACVGKISGAVGTYAFIPPSVEEYVMSKLGLGFERPATQVVARDRHAEFFLTLSLIASNIERVALEIRHLQRTEVREVEEYFAPSQKGSSAMPHKKNPIISENLCGLARILRSNTIAALENIALWHERDISHSSVERIIAPDCCILIEFMLKRATALVSNLVVLEDNIEQNLWYTKGLFYSGAVLSALTAAGVARDKAYDLVQKIALKCFNQGLNFVDEVLANEEIADILPTAKLNDIFKLDNYTKHVDLIFSEAFQEEDAYES